MDGRRLLGLGPDLAIHLEAREAPLTEPGCTEPVDGRANHAIRRSHGVQATGN